MYQVYIISGNIGVGKTTLLKEIKTYFNQFDQEIRIIEEPVEKWKYLLNRYYTEKSEKSCYDIQIASYFHFHDSEIEILRYIEEEEKKAKEEMKKAKKNPMLIFVERSPAETVEIFVENLKGKLSDHDYNLLKEIGKKQMNQEIWKNATYIYLDCDDPSVMIDRIEQRRKENNSISGDSLISKEYLFSLSLYYECLFHPENKITEKSHRVNTKMKNKQQVLIKVLKIID